MTFDDLLKQYQFVGTYSKDGKEFLFDICPFCNKEKKFSFNVIKNQGQCFHSDCLKKVNLWSLKKFLEKEEKILVHSSKLEEDCKRYSSNLYNNKTVLQWCTDTRKWNLDIIKKERLGLNDIGTHIMFPLIYREKVVQFKAKPINKELDQPYWEPANKPSVPFGVDSLDRTSTCLIVEGEPDRIAALSYGLKTVLTAGGFNNFKSDYKKFFNKCDKVYISFDMPDEEHPDEDIKGQKGAYHTAGIIGINKCLNVELPLHDMNECLIYGIPQKDLFGYIKGAKRFKVPGWTNGLEEELQDIKLPDPIPTGIHPIDYITEGGFRPGLYLVGAESGVGKTSLARFLCYKLLLQKIKCGFMPFERGKKWYLAKMKQLANGTWNNILPFMETHDKSCQMYRGEEEFITDLRSLVLTSSVRVIFIDDLKYLFDNFVNPGKDVWQSQSRIMMKLQDFADEMEIPIILLTPFNKAAASREKKQMPVPRQNDVAGSANIPGSASGIWVIQRNYENNPEIEDYKDPNLCRLWVLKNRDAEKTGPMKLYFESTTKQFKEDAVK